MNLPEVLRTERLVLRRPRIDDANAVFEEYAQDPEVTRYLPWSPHQNIDETIGFLTHLDEGWLSQQEFTWGLTLAGTDRVIGMLAFRPRGHKADMGYVLGRGHWGRGLMVEAARAVMDTALRDPSLVRLWAMCDVDNAASSRVLEKLGMTFEGVLRSYLMHPNASPQPRDMRVYALVRPTPGTAA